MPEREMLNPELYEWLRARAHAMVRREGAHLSLSPTDVLHEAWGRLRGMVLSDVEEGHFRALVARHMRFVLIEESRKRGRRPVVEALDEGGASGARPFVDFAAWHDFLERLQRIEPRGVQVLDLLVTTAHSKAEVAHLLSISERTVAREYQKARAVLVGAGSSGD